MEDKMKYLFIFLISYGEVLAQFGDFKMMKSNVSNFDNFLSIAEELMSIDQPCSKNGVPNLVRLIEYIINTHMKSDTPVILFDEFYSENANFHVSLKHLQMRSLSALRYGKVKTSLATPQINNQLFKPDWNEHLSFFIIIKNLDLASDIIELYVNSCTKVVIMSQATKFHLKTFLSSSTSRLYPNLLVVEDPTMQLNLFGESEKQNRRKKNGNKCDINLYTHELFTDSLGSSKSILLTAWRQENLTRSEVSLFPNKFKNGLRGQHFVVAAAEAPPYVLRKRGQNSGEGYMVTKWEGIEIRLIESLAGILGFTYEFVEPQDSSEDGADRVLNEVLAGKAHIGIGGIYSTEDRAKIFSLSVPHTLDCAAFISLASTALPKYRAIMGPFFWDVWLALTATYILAMFPIAFSEWHSLRPLIDNPSECENTFWYVFGTFTNCFTFVGKNSWGHTKNVATRIFIGSYWAFTIMITAAYTGSLITFITIPEMPEVIDTPRQIVEKDFTINTIVSGGWVNLLRWAEDDTGIELWKRHHTVPDVLTGLNNVTQSIKLNEPTAFLGSKEHLDFVVTTNFTTNLGSKKTVFHTSRVCFTPLLVSLVLPNKALYSEEINIALIKAFQAGFIIKITNQVHWLMYRSSTGKLLQSVISKSVLFRSGDRQLTLDDTSGMFLLLGTGFSIAALVHLIEIITWIRHDIKQRKLGHPTIKKRISNYCIDNCRKLSALFLSPGKDYADEQDAYIWHYIYNQAKRRFSAVGWSLFGSPVRQASHPPSPHRLPPPKISITRNSF